jgi:hypothetical protein
MKGPAAWNQSGDGPFENRSGGGRRTAAPDKPVRFNSALGMLPWDYGMAPPAAPGGPLGHCPMAKGWRHFPNIGGQQSALPALSLWR